ncbi:MAG: calcineurin-like phosphoesterase C-terminal domain-containing protein [Marinifilaceae bacterium]
MKFNKKISMKGKLWCAMILLFTSFIYACSDDDKSSERLPEVSYPVMITNIYLPQTEMEFYPDKSQLVIQGKGFQASDRVLFKSGEEHILTIDEYTSLSATVTLPSIMKDGVYELHLLRGNKKQRLGTLNIAIFPFEHLAATGNETIMGRVYANGKGISGVAVSDGEHVVVTDAEGVYRIESMKDLGYVFVSMPSGYMVKQESVFPLFYKHTSKNADEVEELNFALRPHNTTNHALIFCADMHLANRNNDITQFQSFLSDVKEYGARLEANNTNVYGFNLGDMTWDAYWYSNKYAISEYKKTISAFPWPMFHVQGNHDNDPYVADDKGAEVSYRELIGPNYYSFNLGDVHYIVLDNVIYKNVGGTDGKSGDRSYDRAIDPIQLEWLKKDLATITDKSTPIVVAMHCQLYRYSGWNGSIPNLQPALKSAAHTEALEDCFSAFDKVIVVTGHTHKNANGGRKNILELNIAAVSATWWWTGTWNNQHICKDGSPGGYATFQVTGRDIKWNYKGMGMSDNYQFRVYDLNTITAANGGTPGSNELLVNVWGWDPEWKVEILEGSVALDVQPVYTKDPLHQISYLGETSDFVTDRNIHFFKATASQPNTPITVKVTNRFGQQFEELMVRPKEFTTSMR